MDGIIYPLVGRRLDIPVRSAYLNYLGDFPSVTHSLVSN